MLGRLPYNYAEVRPDRFCVGVYLELVEDLKSLHWASLPSSSESVSCLRPVVLV